MGVVDEVKERLDIVDVISGYVPLKKAGRSFKGLCPFHTEKTPSFCVFPETQTWHCFGACNTGGDVFTFIMRRENLEFSEALSLLAQRAGVALEPRGEVEAAAGKTKERLQKLNVLAAEYFHQLLLSSSEGVKAREYLARRGLSDQTSETFQLGCARDDWHALGTHLNAKGYSWADLSEAGLVVEREGGGYYDRFRGRLIFPIRDVRGQIVGFGARALDDSLPKYLNSPQTPLFDKSGVLYGIDQAKGPIRDQGQAVIVEGYMDVLMAHQYGRKNVVASMGTALAEKQIRVLKKLTKKLVLALDPDAAGEQAVLRDLESARQNLDQAVPVPTSHGLIHYQGRLDAEIKIASLPAGLDPDEVIRADVARWDAIIGQALPIVEYYLSKVLARFDLQSPMQRNEAAKEVFPILAEVAGDIERSYYVQKLAGMLRMDEKLLFGAMRANKSAHPPAPKGVERRGRLSSQRGLDFGREMYVLLLLRKHPDLLPLMNAELAALGLASLGTEDFSQTEERALFELIARQIEQYNALDADRMYQQVEPPLRQAFERMLSLAERAAVLPDEQAELDATFCALHLRQMRLRRQSEQLRYLQDDARAQGDGEAARRWAAMVQQLTVELDSIQKASAAQSSLRFVRAERT